MDELDIKCQKHKKGIIYICSYKNCAQNILICEKCKIKEYSHYSNHTEYMMKLKQFNDLLKSKSKGTYFQKSVRQCQKYIQNLKKSFENDILNIHTQFNYIKNKFLQIANQYLSQIILKFQDFIKKFNQDFQKIKYNLKQYKQQIDQSPVSNQQNKQDHLKNIVSYYSKIFQIRAQIKKLKQKIVMSKNNKPNFVINQQHKKQALQNYINTFFNSYLQFIEAQNQQKNKDSNTMKSSLMSERLSNQFSLISTSTDYFSSLTQKQLTKVILPQLNEKIKIIKNKLPQFKLNQNFRIPIKQNPYRFQQGIYRGQLKNTMREGIGQFIFNNGTLYEGQWHNDKINGYGRLITGDYYYEGQISNGRAQGFGKYQDQKVYYQGQWKQDKRNGKGIQVDILNNKKYDGQFINNLYEGIGIIQDQNYLYHGYFKDGLFDRNGKIKYKNGQVYEGTFIKGKKHMVIIMECLSMISQMVLEYLYGKMEQNMKDYGKMVNSKEEEYKLCNQGNNQKVYGRMDNGKNGYDFKISILRNN